MPSKNNRGTLLNQSAPIAYLLAGSRYLVEVLLSALRAGVGVGMQAGL
jgi:hypothetical protein